MASEDSDDEPLSVLAALKKRDESEIEITPIFELNNHGSSTKIKSLKKECDVSINLQSMFGNEQIPVVERPADVWMYLTDFSATGPYSCLLCTEWFINKNRMVIHYVVDHKKDYCGICRYFVPNREAWWEHLKFHMPWKCSQCEESFMSQIDLREHFSVVHKLVHCRLCSLRLPDDEQYHNHLYKKHCITASASAYGEVFWEFQFSRGCQKFLCLLCSKTNNVGRSFTDHFMCYHHSTLKCFMFLISGADLPFSVKGVDLTPEFIDTELKMYRSYGYVDFEKTLKVKQEHIPNHDEVSVTVDCYPDLKDTLLNENTQNTELVRGYKGEEDFDITLMEVIIMQQCYYDYVDAALKDVLPSSSDISYIDTNRSKKIICCLCEHISETVNTFETHMTKMHSVKFLPVYWCRICAAYFDSLAELEAHSSEELGEFENLWICQFCDREFDGREETRKHTADHWDEIKYDNCFSPHLGFKCRFCATLFWNETDRNIHHVRVHFQKHISDFYKCTTCGEVFGDKVFFIHHYLENHNRDNPTYLLKCSKCSIVLQNVEQMRSHFEAEHPEARKLFCSMEQCTFRPFSHRKTFLIHLKSIHDPVSRQSRSVTCNVCGLEFHSNKACKMHSLQAHGPGKFNCTLCNEVLHTSDERKIHYVIRHPGRHQYQCDTCNKSFQYRSSLYMHKQEHLPNKKDYTCNYCGKVFLKKDSFREHVLIHEAPRHACSFCPMRFVQRSNMLRHERIHTGERPYACKFCPRTFADKGACTSHTRTHLKNTSYACVYCGQTFVQKTKLTYHIRKHTGENLETCSLCSKIFTSACSLREHMKIHQRKKMKKTVKCPLCNNMYSDDRNMMRHMRSAHTGARFKCPLCRKTVCSASSLREHVITHSHEKAYKCKICPKSYHSKKTIKKHVLIRHGVKQQEVKTHYRLLDPQECNLGLDADVMERIFGKLKKKPNTDQLIGDFVTFSKNRTLPSEFNQVEDTSRRPDPSELSEENESEEENREDNFEIKMEPHDEEEIPPLDFVNVKTEFVEENIRSDTEMA